MVRAFFIKLFMKRSNRKVISLGVWIVLILLFYEFSAVYIGRPIRRRRVFDLASKKSKQTGKQLLVIGDPYADNYSLSKSDYGCGDICLDINGSTCPISRKHDINQGLGQFGDNQFVVFVSCTLEYVDDLGKTYNELKRISGNDLFIVNMEPYTIKTLFFPNLGYSFKRKWRITDCPPFSNSFRYRPI